MRKQAYRAFGSTLRKAFVNSPQAGPPMMVPMYLEYLRASIALPERCGSCLQDGLGPRGSQLDGVQHEREPLPVTWREKQEICHGSAVKAWDLGSTSCERLRKCAAR